MEALRADPTAVKGTGLGSLVLSALDVVDSYLWDNIVARVAAVHKPAAFAPEIRGA